MRRWFVAMVLLWCVGGVVACTFAELDTRGFPCDTDDVCTGALKCLGGYCLKQLPEPLSEQIPEEPLPDGNPEPPQDATDQPDTKEPDDIRPELRPESKPEPQPSDGFLLPQGCKGKQADCQVAQFLCGGECSISAVSPKDAQGAFYVGGTFSKTLVTSPTQTYESKGLIGGFLLKLDGTNRVAWVKTFGGTDKSRTTNDVYSVALDTSGNVYMFAIFTSTLHFEGQTYPTKTLDRGTLLAKYSPDGKLLWHKILNGPSFEQASTISIGPQGNIYALGSYSGSIEIEQKTLKGTASTVFLASWTPQGKLRWTANIGSSFPDYGLGMGWQQNKLWVAAEGFDALPALVNGQRVGTTNSSNARFALLQFSIDGTLQAHHFSQGMGNVLNGRFAVNNGALYLFAEIKGSHNVFGKSCGDNDITSLRMFAAKIESTGKAAWCTQTSPGKSLSTRAVLPRRDGGILVAGTFRDDLTLSASLPLKNKGNSDFFIASISDKGLWQWALHGASSKVETISTLQYEDQNHILFSGLANGHIQLGKDTLTFPAGALFLWRLPLP